MDRYLTGGENWTGYAAVGGGAVLGVIVTRTLDNYAAPRLHPLALFALKCAAVFGLGMAAGGAGYERVATGLVFGGFADSTVTYADQIQYRYLPGAPSMPALPPR